MSEVQAVSRQENVRTVQQLYAAFGRGDLQAILEALADEVEWAVAGPAQVPYAGMRQGKTQVARFFAVLGQTVDLLQFEPREFIAQDETVVVIGFERLRVKATGRIAENHWVMVFTLRDGRVVRFHEHGDTAAVAAAFRNA